MVRELQDNMKCNNIHIIGIPEGEEEEQGVENLFEKVMKENFPSLRGEKVTQIQETQRVPIKRNTKRPSSRHIIIKMAKFQDRILKAARKTGSSIQGSPNKTSSCFLKGNAEKGMTRNILFFKCIY